MFEVVKYEKIKEKIYFYDTEGRNYSYNFKTKVWRGLRGKPLSGVPKLASKKIEIQGAYAFARVNCEWIFSYPELIDWEQTTTELSQAPSLNFIKGIELSRYLKFLKEEGLKISPSSYHFFENDLPFKELWKERWYKNVPAIFKKKAIFDGLDNPSFLKDFYKMQVISAKEGERIQMWTYGHYSDLYSEKWFVPDVNRGILYNQSRRLEIKKEQLNKALSIKLKKIAPLDGIQIDDLKIVVPRGIADLQEEGKAQHNCVGYYYNEGMINGEGFCFFLRTLDGDSYITCRFDNKSKTIVEYKKKNNMTVNPMETEKYIVPAQAIIREFLEKGN